MNRTPPYHRFRRAMALLSLSLLSLLLLAQSNPGRASTNATATYPIVDTGQTNCYDDTGSAISCPAGGQPFSGQDAQHNGHQPSYTNNGDGTITDNNTGLMWVQAVSSKMTYAAALAGAETFNLAGYDDWRLPTIKELYSLILFSGLDPSGCQSLSQCPDIVPFINTAYFDFAYGDTSAGERLIDAQYWSSTEYVATTMNGDATTFGVNFADGRIKGYPSEPVGPPGQQFTMSSFVRYVRGSSYGVNAFVNNGDGTITDQATLLMWAQADSGSGLNWEEALAWTAQKNAENYLGHNDWRLPNAKELQSIVDYSRAPAATSSAAIDPIFSVTPITDEGGSLNYPFYWTSTTHANWTAVPGQWSVYIAFGEALGWMQPPTGGDYVLQDVHGAGAQRSDPKSGNPDDWPYGNGPQGDVVRIFNFARLVRDAAPEPVVSHTIFLPTLAGSSPRPGAKQRPHNPSRPGIPAADLPYIFDRFYRGDPSRQAGQAGSGLGLAIVKSLVLAHNGKITVASSPGTGTTFTILLPGPGTVGLSSASAAQH